MLLAARNIDRALPYVTAQSADDPELESRIEAGKKTYVGYELAGHTLGVVGLGKIGCLVADVAIKLGMDVIGYDPEITVEAAWSLPARSARRTTWATCCGTATSSPCMSRWSTPPGP